MRRSFRTNEFYHLFNRGVDKRKIFLEKGDYIRFVHDLYEFNDTKPAAQFFHVYFEEEGNKDENIGSRVSNIEVFNMGMSNAKISKEKISKIEKKKTKNELMKDNEDKKDRKRDLLVNLHAFVLMPNHHHLLAEQIIDGGISLYMRKIHTGYTNAFNLKYKRGGHLFQGPFKDVHIEDDVQLGFLICYLHSNPLSLWMPNWQTKKLNSSEIKKALRFLEKYRWSSHLDYLGIKNFPSAINKEFLLEFFDGTEGYKEFFINWLEQYKKNFNYIKDFIID